MPDGRAECDDQRSDEDCSTTVVLCERDPEEVGEAQNQNRGADEPRGLCDGDVELLHQGRKDGPDGSLAERLSQGEE